MWIFLSDAFMSIVEDRQHEGNLLVRSRFASHLRHVFPEAKVIKTPRHDYAFRVSVPRKEVAQVIAARIASIDYANFKNTVAERPYPNACLSVWGAMFTTQERQLQKRRSGKKRNKHFDGFSYLFPEESETDTLPL
jgi:hypothetical protein